MRMMSHNRQFRGMGALCGRVSEISPHFPPQPRFMVPAVSARAPAPPACPARWWRRPWPGPGRLAPGDVRLSEKALGGRQAAEGGKPVVVIGGAVVGVAAGLGRLAAGRVAAAPGPGRGRRRRPARPPIRRHDRHRAIRRAAYGELPTRAAAPTQSPRPPSATPLNARTLDRP